MKRFLSLLGILSTALAVFVPMSAAQATWVSDHCTAGSSVDDHVRRADAQAYSAVGDNEGYEWGGGCWNDNNIDDTPGQPDSSGEGADCSGFTFKTWELHSTQGHTGWTFYDKLKNIHGPYTAAEYHDPGGPPETWPFKRLRDKNRSTTLYMDAFASTTHIGMLYTSSNPSSSTDYIIEALGDAAGTDINVEDFRYDSAYVGVRRLTWTADCYPRCLSTPNRRLIVVT